MQILFRPTRWWKFPLLNDIDQLFLTKFTTINSFSFTFSVFVGRYLEAFATISKNFPRKLRLVTLPEGSIMLGDANFAPSF